MATVRKKTGGRRKVELKRIENEEARYVTFSKRKLSLFKKAAELATLCGAEIALLLFSPAGRPYSLGLPTMDDVFHRILSSGPAQMGFRMAGRSVASPWAARCAELTKHLEREKSRKAILAERLQVAAPRRWEDGLDGLGWDELLAQAREVEELRSRVDSRLRGTQGQGASSSENPIAASLAGGSEAHPRNPGVFCGVRPRGPPMSPRVGL